MASEVILFRDCLVWLRFVLGAARKQLVISRELQNLRWVKENTRSNYEQDLRVILNLTLRRKIILFFSALKDGGKNK